MRCEVLILCCVVLLAGATTTCTVHSAGTGMFTTINAALLGCGGNNIVLLLQGLFAEIINFPATMVSVVLRSQDITNQAIISGFAHNVPQFSGMAISFSYVQLTGLGTTMPFWGNKLRGTNVSFDNVQVTGFAGLRWYQQESCELNSQLYVTNSLFSGLPGNVFFALHMQTLWFVNNTFQQCGGSNDTSIYGSVLYLQMLDTAPQGAFVFTQNIGWRTFDNFLTRCYYPMDGNWNTRCYQGAVQCYDAVTTAAKGICPDATYTATDPRTNQTATVAGTPNPLCRTYTQCVCQNIEISANINGTISTVVVNNGNLFYEADNGFPYVNLSCMPGVGAITNYTFQAAYPSLGDNAVTLGYPGAETLWPSGLYTSQATMESQCTCPPPVPLNPRTQHDFPCIYNLVPGIVCDEGEAQCCVDQPLLYLYTPTTIVNATYNVTGTPQSVYEAVFVLGTQFLTDCVVIAGLTVTNCTSYLCPSNALPASWQALQATCVLNGTVQGPVATSSASIFRVPTNTSQIYDATALQLFGLVSSQAPTALFVDVGGLNCTTQLFWPCTCNNPLVPAEYTNPLTNLPVLPNCTNGTVLCDCGQSVLTILYPPSNGTVWLWINNIPVDVGFFQFIDNMVAPQYQYGVRIVQVPLSVVQYFATVDLGFVDKQVLMRILSQQLNDQILGATAAFVQNPPGSDLEVTCNASCPYAWTSLSQCGCIVNDEVTSLTPNFGVTMFPNVTMAAAYASTHAGGCVQMGAVSPVICPQQGVQYFAEIQILIYGHAQNLSIVCFDEALIAGSQHTIDPEVNQVALVGCHWSHPGDRKFPIWTVAPIVNGQAQWWAYVGNLNLLVMTNNFFYGSQCRQCGVLNTIATNFVHLSFNNINQFEEFGVVVQFALSVEVNYNMFSNVRGKGVLVSAYGGMAVTDNTFYQCRGGSRVIGAPLVRMTGLNAGTCTAAEQVCIFDIRTFRFTCVSAAGTCFMVRNVQMLSLNASDDFDNNYPDVCFQVAGTSMPATNIAMNVCIKAQYGLDLFQPNAITLADIPLLQMQNPGIRPFMLQNPKQHPGADYRYRGIATFSLQNGFFWQSFVKQLVNFLGAVYKPLAPLRELFLNGTLTCRTNLQWTTPNLGFYTPGVGYGMVYGFWQFRNISDGFTYCPQHLVQPWPTLYMDNTNGSRAILGNWTANTNVTLYGQSPDAYCYTNVYLPISVSAGNQLTAPSFEMVYVMLAWQGNQPQSQQFLLFSSDEQLPQAFINITGCIFDGLLIQVQSQMRVLFFWLGQHLTAKQLKLGSPRPLTVVHGQPIWEPLNTTGFFYFVNNTMRNWISVDPATFQTTDGGDTFPYVSGLYVRAVPTSLSNARTTAIIANNTFVEIDSLVVQVRDIIRIYFSYNLLFNVSGRDPNDPAAVELSTPAANLNASFWTVNFTNVIYVTNNNVSQQRPILYPQSVQDVMNPIWLTAFYFYGVSNESTSVFCFFNNSVDQHFPAGFRIANSNRTVLNMCPERGYGAFWPDLRSSLRNICLQNFFLPLLKSQFANFIWDPVGDKDRYRNGLYCNINATGACCPLTPPTICVIDQFTTLPAYTAINYWRPGNPFMHTYQFVDPQECIDRCLAVHRTCLFTGDQNFWGVPGTTVQRTYNLQFDYTVGPRLLPHFNNVTNMTVLVPNYDPLILQGAPGMTIVNAGPAGHYINTIDGVKCTVTGMTFFQSPASGAPTWQQPATASSVGLTITSSIFNGTDNPVRPMDGTFDGSFALLGTLFVNYTGHDGALITGRACDGVSNVTVKNNAFIGFVGTTLQVAGWQFMYVDGNTFDQCGGQCTDRVYMLWIQPCNNGVPGLYQVFKNNINTMQTTSSTLGRWTSIAIDPRPPATVMQPLVQQNICKRLEVGVRVVVVPLGPPTYPQENLAFVYLDNPQCSGSWHWAVNEPPADDAATDTSPVATREFTCDPNTCIRGDYQPLIWFILICLAIIACICCLWCYCCVCGACSQELVYSQVLQKNVPADTFFWPWYFSDANKLQLAENAAQPRVLPAPVALPSAASAAAPVHLGAYMPLPQAEEPRPRVRIVDGLGRRLAAKSD
jgi:hypothetical protein